MEGKKIEKTPVKVLEDTPVEKIVSGADHLVMLTSADCSRAELNLTLLIRISEMSRM